MTRFTSSIVALAFFLQQGNCCCGETVCNVWLSVMTASESCCSLDHVDVDGHHDEDGPSSRHSHEHHLCVGTHVFYLDTASNSAIDRLEVNAWDLPTFEFIQVDLLLVTPSYCLKQAKHSDLTPALPLRAELQVFQI